MNIYSKSCKKIDVLMKSKANTYSALSDIPSQKCPVHPLIHPPKQNPVWLHLSPKQLGLHRSRHIVP